VVNSLSGPPNTFTLQIDLHDQTTITALEQGDRLFSKVQSEDAEGGRDQDHIAFADVATWQATRRVVRSQSQFFAWRQSSQELLDLGRAGPSQLVAGINVPGVACTSRTRNQRGPSGD
jgi:hypothetical protein